MVMTSVIGKDDIHKIMDILISISGKQVRVVSCGSRPDRTIARLDFEDGTAVEFSGSNDSFDVNKIEKK